jgi:5S rRNA maturation endonuclease (ribonuclease M5)
MDLQQIKKKLNDNWELVFKELGMQYENFGDNIYSTCPIHEGSDNPRAFSYSVSKGIWKCWTRDCQHSHKNDIFGLIIGALSAKENIDIDFSQALKWSCKLLKIDKSYSQNKKQEPDQLKEGDEDFFNVINIFKSDTEEYKHKKVDIKCDVCCPSTYFVGRGFSRETLEHFNVGDCYDSGSKLRDRAIIPIHDDAGNDIVGVIGRAVKEYISPKFLLHPKGFDKRYFFYNYHRAIEKVKETSCLFIVEGQGDVWRLYEAGVFNAVSIFGKTISKQQEEKLQKLPITHLIILTDNDQAGREAKVQIKRQLSRMYKLTFPKMSTKDVGEMTTEQIKSKILQNLKGTF